MRQKDSSQMRWWMLREDWVYRDGNVLQRSSGGDWNFPVTFVYLIYWRASCYNIALDCSVDDQLVRQYD